MSTAPGASSAQTPGRTTGRTDRARAPAQRLPRGFSRPRESGKVER